MCGTPARGSPVPPVLAATLGQPGRASRRPWCKAGLAAASPCSPQLPPDRSAGPACAVASASALWTQLTYREKPRGTTEFKHWCKLHSPGVWLSGVTPWTRVVASFQHPNGDRMLLMLVKPHSPPGKSRPCGEAGLRPEGRCVSAAWTHTDLHGSRNSGFPAPLEKWAVQQHPGSWPTRQPPAGAL